MTDLTQWVELWEIEPELVPPGWWNEGDGAWTADFTDGHKWESPDDCSSVSIYAQIGKAVEWLCKHRHAPQAPCTRYPTPLEKLYQQCRGLLEEAGKLPIPSPTHAPSTQGKPSQTP